MSRAKFWQMIGRGTRTCVGLMDGKDSQQFYIFDLCGNFEFFRLHAKGREVGAVSTLQERLFSIKLEIAYKLQEISFQTDELRAYREKLVRDLAAQVKALPREDFAVKQHLRIIDKYQSEEDFDTLTYENTLQIAEHIAPLVPPTGDDSSADRFDMLLYQIELAMLDQKNATRAKNDVARKAEALTKYGNIPTVAQQKELLEQIIHNEFLERASIPDYEDMREKLRDLIKFIPEQERVRYDTDFTDDVLSTQWNESKLDNDDLLNYKKRVNYYSCSIRISQPLRS